MKTLALFVAVAFVGQAQGSEFTVVNKMPKFVVVNRMPAKVFVNKTVATTRAAHGHTHTCPHCLISWDHLANASHNCLRCGRQVLVQDRVARPVAAFKTVRVEIDAPASPPRVPAPVAAPRVIISLPVSSGGCENGQCGAPQFRFR